MLKITRVGDGEPDVLLTLEGKLLGPWVGELETACPRPEEACRLRLDLAAVSFVDESGVRLLRALLDRGAAVVAASGFVAALLGLEDR